ncbi:hypothetical protein FB451DRAFT_1142400 [Mycena latifolia]|nr:hypothetical protein FB451DRAFT_1142400 [Mycena latifolia]
MSDNTPSIQDAPAPFSGAPDPEDNIPPPDFVLRAGDGVDLHVHKDILKFVSIFFKNMFDGSVGVTELERDGKPIVVLPESSLVLHRLLCIAYPGRSLEHYSLAAQTLDSLWAVHEVAQKYLFIGAKELLEKMLEEPTLLNAHPHRVFAIARLRDLPDLARKAALATLQFAVSPPALVFPELDLLPATTFQALHNFHHRCGQQAVRLVESHATSLEPEDIGQYSVVDPYITKNTDTDNILVWWNGRAGFHSTPCAPRQEFRMESVMCDSTQWFQHHTARLSTQLRAIPTRSTVEQEAVTVAPAERELIKSCHACFEFADRDLSSFARQLAMRIEASNNELAQEL